MASNIEKFRQPAIGMAVGTLGVVFLATGLSKLLGAPFNVAMFGAFGLPLWAMYVVGGLEIASAALLFVPRTRFFGAFGICALMLGAAGVHLLSGFGAPMVLLNGLLFAVAAWVGSQTGMTVREPPPLHGGPTAGHAAGA
jgi:hypothetical protein